MDTQDVQAQDVAQEAESETAVDSSIDEKTTQVEEGTDAPAEESQPEQEQAVPYSRFKEVNDRVKQMEAQLEAINNNAPKPEVNPQAEQIKAQLKEMGFVSKEEVETELRRQKEDAVLASELAQLEQRYDGKDGRPKFAREKIVQFALDKQIGDLEAAYKLMNEKALIDHAIKSAVSKTGGVKSEASDGSSTAEAGTTDADLREAIGKGDKAAQRMLLKRIAQRALGRTK